MSKPFSEAIVYPVVREVLNDYADVVETIMLEISEHLTPIIAKKAEELVAQHISEVSPIDIVTILLAEMERVHLIHLWLLKEHQGEDFRKACEDEFDELDLSYQALLRQARRSLPSLSIDPVFQVAQPATEGGEQ